ncbi:MAG: hypothetical protein FJ221_12400 [Lentisphaerae bacterium]|nr:hypothetical protein [Lentisphaerota bacterium]
MTAPSPSWSKRRRRLEALLGLAAGLAVRNAAAAGTESAPPSTAAPPGIVHFSTTQRFAALGADPLQTVPFLAWVEEVAERLERALGAPMPAERGRPLVFVLSADPAGGAAAIRRELQADGRGFGQVVRIANPDRAEPAEVLAAAVSMMAARYVAARQPPAVRGARPALAPDWFACGLAGSLYSGPRLTLQRRALDAWLEGKDPPLASLLGPGPAAAPFAPLAEWTVLVSWLRLRPDFPAVAGGLLDAWAAGQDVDAARLAARLDTAWSARDLAQQIDLAYASARRVDVPWRLTPSDLAARLRECLRVPHARVPIVLPDDVADPIDIHALVTRRSEPWARTVAQAMLMSIDQIPVGRDGTLTRAVNAYRGVLRRLAQPGHDGVTGGIVRRIGTWRLRRALASADRRFDDLEAVRAAGPEAPAPPGPAPAADPAADDARLEAEAMRRIFHDGFRAPP